MAITRCYRCGKLASTDYACNVCGSERHIELGVSDQPSVPLEDRKAYVETVPWVKRLKKKVQCDGWMPKNKKCKNPAEWSYRWTSSRNWRNTQKRQHFCWNHLSSRGLYGDMQEEARWQRWQEKNPPPWRKDDDVRRQGSEPKGEGETRERSIPKSNRVQSDAEVGASDGDQ
jgi:hypothetical protein